jgi:hypothetical protein
MPFWSHYSAWDWPCRVGGTIQRSGFGSRPGAVMNSLRHLEINTMANQRTAILAAIDVQAKHEGETANIKACRAIAQHVKTSSEWQALISMQYHRYGKLSYETHRFHYVRDWVKPLVAELQGIDQENPRLSGYSGLNIALR